MGWADNERDGDDNRRSGDGPSRYQRGERRGGKVVREYDYDSPKGENYHRIERTEDKQFPQSHWVPDAQGGHWEFGAPKGPKYPYLLSDLIAAAPETPVFICEGEKDTETVFGMGLVATCNPNGAGKWRSEFDQWFEGRKQVFILEDNDRPGRNHSLKVARNLCRVVADVRIVHFTKLPNGEPMAEGGDVSDWVAAGGTKEQLLELAAAAPAFVGLPEIQVRAGQPARAQDETETALIKAGQPVLVRAGKLVQPIWSQLPTAKGGLTTVTVLRPITVTNLAYIASKHACTFVKFDKRTKGLVPVDPPAAILQGLLERGHWGFPRVAGVINAPTLRPDGSILDQPGHDPATQLWCWPDSNLTMPPINEHPTLDDARAALASLKGLLSEFPFVADLDRAVALAAILTAILRGAFDVAPMFLFLAHAAGTGKSYLVNLISTLVHGRPCPVITASNNKEEMEKRLGSLLLEGAPIISLDNLAFDLEGELLCQITEQPLVKTRILGKSETPECEWRGTMFATGNNVTPVGDLTRRCLIANLDAGVERPETRKFNFNPIENVLAERGTFIAAAITIARAYLISGAKADLAPLGSYGGWSRFVREPLIWLDEPDPVKSMDQARADDPERSAAVALFEQWAEHLKLGEGYTSTDIIECAREIRLTGGMAVGGPDAELVRPAFNGLLMDRCPSPKGIDARAFGKWLSKIKGQVHIGYKLVILKKDPSRGNRWALVKTGRAGGEGEVSAGG